MRELSMQETDNIYGGGGIVAAGAGVVVVAVLGTWASMWAADAYNAYQARAAQERANAEARARAEAQDAAERARRNSSGGR